MKEEVTFIGDTKEEKEEEYAEEELLEMDEDNRDLSHELRDQIRIAKEQNKRGPKKEGYYSHDDLHDALLYAFDMLERASLNFVLLGETARQVKEHAPHPILSLDYIHLGILDKALNRYGISTLETVIDDFVADEKNITFSYNGVPIVMDVIKEDTRYFDNPDIAFYYTETMSLPNPFDEYWENKDNIS